jgi:hypothetical protein
MTDYPIKRPLDETECEECGRLLAVGHVAIEDKALLFCSEDCAAAFEPEGSLQVILKFPGDHAAEDDGPDQSVDNAICETKALPKPIRQGLLFPL